MLWQSYTNSEFHQILVQISNQYYHEKIQNNWRLGCSHLFYKCYSSDFSNQGVVPLAR
jgi:predicted component of type VI protein secretion system